MSDLSAAHTTTFVPRRGSVLVIDDEELIGNAIKRLVRKQHDATVALSASEALRLMAEHHYDAVVCDLLMPKMSGIELYGELREIDPRLAGRMIFLTGGGFAPTSTTAIWVAAVPNLVLEKPYESFVLAQAIDDQVQAFSDNPRR